MSTMNPEEYFTIRRPVVSSTDMRRAGEFVARGLTMLTGRPSASVLRAAEAMGYYIRRELRYDFPLFSAAAWPIQGLYLLHEDDFERAPAIRCRVIGAAHVRPESWESADDKLETLNWVWLHPFYRNNGVFAGVWRHLERRHAPMAVQYPHSPAMKKFLAGKEAGVAGVVPLYGQRTTPATVVGQ